VRLAVGFAAGGLVLMALFYLVPELLLWRGVLLPAVLIGFLLVCLIRLLSTKLFSEDLFRRRVLFLGAGRRVASSLQRVRRRADQRGFKIMGFIAIAGDDIQVQPDRLIPSEPSLLDVATSLDIDEIVVAMDDRRLSFPIEPLPVCRLNGVEVIDLVEFLERETGKVNVKLMSPSYIIFSPGFSRSAARNFTARAFDILGSVALLFLALPVMLLAALAIVSDGGPVLYRQVRVGLEGKPFNLLKFRSMRVDAEQGGKAQWAARNDDRVTPIGRILRKYRIDELPQLVNVLKGEMSIVGPRPERPEFVEDLACRIPYYRERHYVKPGLTGWAQLCYPYGSCEDDAVEKLQYDLYYVKNHSLLFDCAILLQTAEVVLWQKGAR
jgi:sugar transferase (PEP-CTERM system associated)